MFRQCDFFSLCNLRKSRGAVLPFSPDLTDGLFANCIRLFSSEGARMCQRYIATLSPFRSANLFAI